MTFTSGRQLTVKELAAQYQVSPWIKNAATLSDLQVARTNQRSVEMIVKALEKFGER